jgi:PAS domain S-box-containing protein
MGKDRPAPNLNPSAISFGEREADVLGRHFHDVIDSLPAAIYTTDAQGRITYFNPACVEFSGRTPELGSDHWCVTWKLFYPDGRPMPHDQCPMAIALKEGRVVHGTEAIAERPDGTRVWFAPYPTPLLDDSGKVIGGINMLVDITERKQAEESKSRLAAIVESSDDAIISKGLDGVISSWNAGAERLFGYTAAEAIGQPITMLIPPDRLEEEPKIIERLKRGERVDHFETQRVRKDGSLLDVSLTISPVKSASGRVIGASKIARDITERKRVHEALSKSEQRARNALQELQLTYDQSPVGMLRLDRDLRYVLINEQLAAMNGVPAAEHIGKTIHEIVPDLAPKIEAGFRHVMETCTPRIGIELKGYTAADPGVEHTWLESWFPVRDAAGEVVGLNVVAEDITDSKKAEEALRSSHAAAKRAREYAEATLRTLPIPLLVLECDMRVVSANEAFYKRFMVEPNETEGRLIYDLGNGQWNIPELRQLLENILPRHEWFEHFEVTHDFQLIGRRTMLLNARRMEVEEGGPERIVLVMEDITDRKLAEEQISRGVELLNVIVDRSPTGFYIVDADFRISHINADSQARAFRNVNPAIGRRLDDAMRVLWPEPLATEIINIFRHTLDTGEPYKSPGLESPRADVDWVETYEWQLQRITMPDGRHAVVCHYYDTTRLREAEQALRDADRRKDEFIATLAHELRNPLAPLRNGLQVMKLTKDDPQRVEEVRDIMERQLEQMVHLIDDLMDVSRITRGKVQLRMARVDLKQPIEAAIETSRPLIDECGHNFTVYMPTQPIFVDADATRLAQIVANLLNNAAKYTDRGGNITLSVERQADDVVIAVRDSGIGIPTEMLDSVFEAFAQVDRSLEKSQGGLGIGLSLVKGLVEMHGGTVEAHSDGPGKGSEFVIRLPAAVPPDKHAVGTCGNGHALAPAHRCVLIVDDNRDAANSLAVMLRLQGLNAQTAHDGLEAIQIAAASRPDVVLMDIGMPKLNGYDAARRIRSEPWGKDIKLIALTGWGHEQDRQKSSDAGFDHHLVKPVDEAALLNLLAGTAG